MTKHISKIEGWGLYLVGFVMVSQKVGMVVAFGVLFMILAFDLKHYFDYHND